jgi:integrase
MIVLPALTESNAPALIRAAGERAQIRFWEFFVNNIRNAHTRRAYGRAIGEFLTWCEQRGLASIVDIEPLHIGAYVEALTRSHSAPTAKQRLATIRMLFDWLVTGQVPTNPAASVRGPKHVVKVGKTPVLDAEEARTLLDSIDVTTPAGLRDRAHRPDGLFLRARRCGARHERGRSLRAEPSPLDAAARERRQAPCNAVSPQS